MIVGAHLECCDGWRPPIKGAKFDPNVDVWLDINRFNQGIPQTVLESVFGNAARNNPKLRSPWRLDQSFAVGRNISIKEQVVFLPGVFDSPERFGRFQRDVGVIGRLLAVDLR